MSPGPLARLRVLTLLVAFGTELFGSLCAAGAMTVPQPAGILAGAAAGGSGCPVCPRDSGIAASPTCVAGFCTMSAALLPPGPIVAARSRPIFPAIATGDSPGISIRPDLGPPIPSRHN